MNSGSLRSGGGGAPPAVPPKPRRPLGAGFSSSSSMSSASSPTPSPLVPRSRLVGAPLEPSYSSRLGGRATYANDGGGGDAATLRSASPASSSYSELRRAANEPPGESLYEPIEPYSRRAAPQAPPAAAAARVAEAEVDALAATMVRAMSAASDSSRAPSVVGVGEDAYGRCAECGRAVVGEASGCAAMGRVYHVGCFACRRCGVDLQGKPFYALDGRPHCEPDYLDALEKCSVCTRPILDRILRATGKPYHPECFACVVCARSLDGVPFTVDATNRVHCIEDFHREFAPRCSVCARPIMPEPGREETVRVVALDRSFHVDCYRCEDCARPLSSSSGGGGGDYEEEDEDGGCYPLDDHVLCKSCNARRVRALTDRIARED